MLPQAAGAERQVQPAQPPTPLQLLRPELCVQRGPVQSQVSTGVGLRPCNNLRGRAQGSRPRVPLHPGPLEQGWEVGFDPLGSWGKPTLAKLWLSSNKPHTPWLGWLRQPGLGGK